MYANDSKLVQRTPSYGVRGVLATAIAMAVLAGCGGGGGSLDPASNSGGGSGGTGSGGGSGSGGGTGSGGSGGGGGTGSGGSGSGGTGSGGSGGGSTTGAPPVVYLAEQDTLDITELYMSTATGSVKINGPLVPDGWVHDFAVSPNGDFVVYAADQDTENRTELYLVNLANPGVATKLSAPLTVNPGVTGFDISSDSSKVVYRAEAYELFLVNVANPGSAVKVNAPLVPDGWVRAGFSFSPDSSQIVYRADQDVLDTTEIFLTNIATPGTSQQLNPELTSGGNVSTAYHFSPDGTKVGYVADQEVDERQELFVVSVATPGVSSKLNGPMTAEGDICRFEFSHDSTRVAYCGDQETDEVMELFLVSLDAPGVSQKLNPALVPGGNVGSHYDFSADDTFIVYEAEQEVVDRNELYRVDLSAPGVATKLNAPIVGGGGFYDNVFYNGVYTFSIRPDGQHVVYVANQESGSVWELYDVDLVNPGAATKLSPAMAGIGLWDFRYSSDGERVVYSAAQDSEFFDLYDIEVSKPAVATKLNGTLAAGGDVWDFAIIP
jgi:Tol biopolymer transport system component